MLNEGVVEVQRVKKDIAKGVESAQTLYKEVTGIWGWLKSLVAPKPPAPVSPIAPAVTAPAKPSKKAKADDGYEDHIPNDDEIVDLFLTNFTTFVEAQTTILDTIADERERILHVWNPKQNNRKAAIELIRYERKINDMALELSEIMAGAPKKLGSVREQFQEKLDQVQAAQAKAKALQRRKEAQERAKEWQIRSDRIDTGWTMLWTAILIFYFWTFMGIVWLNTTTTQ